MAHRSSANQPAWPCTAFGRARAPTWAISVAARALVAAWHGVVVVVRCRQCGADATARCGATPTWLDYAMLSDGGAFEEGASSFNSFPFFTRRPASELTFAGRPFATPLPLVKKLWALGCFLPCFAQACQLPGPVVGECHMLRLQWRHFGLLLSSLGAHLPQVSGESGVMSTKLWGWWWLCRNMRGSRQKKPMRALHPI